MSKKLLDQTYTNHENNVCPLARVLKQWLKTSYVRQAQNILCQSSLFLRDLEFYVWLRSLINSDKMTQLAPPMTKERESFPPGTSGPTFGNSSEVEYRSDQAIAAGRIPNSTNTPYVPAKSKALKKISGSSNASTNGGSRVMR